MSTGGIKITLNQNKTSIKSIANKKSWQIKMNK
jgi:hypothetical protein